MFYDFLKLTFVYKQLFKNKLYTFYIIQVLDTKYKAKI
jgi:hypothetical protein